MSDSFADLWQSSAPTNKPQTLSSLNASNAQPQAQGQRSGQAARAKPDVFALLASNSNSSSSSGGAAYRPQVSAQSMSRTSTATTTGSANSLSSYSYSSQPGSRPSSTRPGSAASAAQPARSNGSDAFGDLFSGSTTSLGSSSSNMTLAARAKMEQEQKQKQAQSRLGSSATTSSTTAGSSGFDAWAGLDALGGGASAPSLTATRSTPASSKSPAVRVDDTDDWGLGDFGAPTVTTSRSTSTQGGAPCSTSTSTSGTSNPSMGSTQDVMIDGISDDWGLHDFGRAGGVNGNGSASAAVASAADDDDILGMLSRPVEDVRTAKPAISLSPSPPPQRSSSSHSNNPPSRSTSTTQPTTRDPPPHILGQIVEMGFSIPQARNALLNTLSPTGDWDVQAALETLLSQSNNGSRAQTPADTTSRRGTPQQQQVPPPQPPRPTERAPPKGRRERDLERQERQERLARLEREIAASASNASSSRPSQSQSESSTVVPAELAQQAERVLEMGKEMGRGMLGKASAFWREGRERVEKALVEREEARSGGASGSGRGMAGARGGAGGAGGRPGAPKWMQDRGGDHDHDEEREDVRSHGALSGYADEEDEHHDSHRAASPGFSSREPTAREDRSTGGDASVDLFSVDDDGVKETTHATQKVEEEVDLFSMPVPSRPAPSRSVPLRQPPSSSSSPAAGSSSNTVRARPPASRPTPTPASTRKRTLTAASPSAIAQASKHRAAGTASFKLGQYADAAQAYSQALDALPAGHLLRIPLLTNRALALIRTGECKGAERDCAEAVRVVVALPASSGSDGFDPSSSGPSAEEQAAVDAWTPSQEPQELVDAGRAKANDAGWEDARAYEGVGVDLIDGYIKARRRRAEALEMQEKWRAAVKDWEALANAPWVGDKVRGEARTGLGRCKRMVGEDGGNANGGGSGSRASSAPSASRPAAPSRPKPRVPVKPASISATPSGAAVKALQATNAQAEAEDTMRHSLKDSVDARLTAWRGGKETNIRALLASLDTVLWPEILAGGVQVSGLGALITPAQVKKGYVKAIARVHPDKLNPTNSTVEQRMLANGVFGTLNEAWIAFQAGAK